MMQYQENYAWMEGNQTVVLRANKEPTYATYDKANKKLSISEKPSDAEAMHQRALSHVLLPSVLYREQHYHLPK